MNRIDVGRNSRLQCVELLIDGQPLGQIFGQGDSDVISPFARRFVQEAVRDSLEVYRGDFVRRDSRLSKNEIELLVCCACGDLLCGNIVADLEIGADTVTWSQPRW